MSSDAHRHLFIDDVEIERCEGFRRTVNQPVHHPANPVLKPERPWEGYGVSHYGTLLYDEDEQLFRLWYLTRPNPKGEPIRWEGRTVPGNRSILCYATSRDAIQWERPSLGQVEFEGSRDNNIVRIGNGGVEGAAIIDEPDDPDPSRRYKTMYWNCSDLGPYDEQEGTWIAFSPDGLHWTDIEQNPIRISSDTSYYVVRDPATGKYFAYGRFARMKVGDEFQRRQDCIESNDFVNWSRGIPVMEADHFDEAPMPETLIYGMTVDLYEGLYLGGVWMYHRGLDHTIDTQLAVSRNGLHWDRIGDNHFWRGHGPDPKKEDLDRQVFLPLGPVGSGYAGMVRPAAQFITRSDSVYMLIGLVEQEHGDAERNFVSQRPFQPCTLGLATLRRDGFVSLNTKADDGVVTSTPMPWPGEPLHVNVDASGGSVHASLLDGREKGVRNLFPRPLSGFEQSEPIKGNQLDAIVRWPGGQVPADQPVRLQLTARNAKLFSYWFATAGK